MLADHGVELWFKVKRQLSMHFNLWMPCHFIKMIALKKPSIDKQIKSIEPAVERTNLSISQTARWVDEAIEDDDVFQSGLYGWDVKFYKRRLKKLTRKLAKLEKKQEKPD